MGAYARSLWEGASDLGPKLALALVIMAVFLLVAKAVRWTLRRLARKRGEEGAFQVLLLAGSTAEIGLVFAGIITALGTIGVNVSALVAALGLTGFALGFALKDALSSLLAGCLILIYRPFRCGQRISVAGSEGVVLEINLRYTTLENQGQRLLVPNSVLYLNTITILK